MIIIKRSHHEDGTRIVYQEGRIITTIAKQGKQYLVCWLTGRVDRHEHYSSARDDALHGDQHRR